MIGQKAEPASSDGTGRQRSALYKAQTPVAVLAASETSAGPTSEKTNSATFAGAQYLNGYSHGGFAVRTFLGTLDAAAALARTHPLLVRPRLRAPTSEC